MPLVDVTHDRSVTDIELRQLAECLPDLVAAAVDCPDEPWVGSPALGDIEIRFRSKGDYDVGQLRLVIEVRTKRFASRVVDQQRRADVLRERLEGLGYEQIGVWLMLVEGAWSQSAVGDFAPGT